MTDGGIPGTGVEVPGAAVQARASEASVLTAVIEAVPTKTPVDHGVLGGEVAVLIVATLAVAKVVFQDHLEVVVLVAAHHLEAGLAI